MENYALSAASANTDIFSILEDLRPTWNGPKIGPGTASIMTVHRNLHKSKTYKPNGKQEVARRLRQMKIVA